MAFVSYLVVRDFKIKMPLRQLVILVFLVATALGVANEVLEFVIQETVGFGFAITVEDTWLDLVSNWAGSIAGLAVFSSAVRK